jgi:SPP1 gp7 family putative phage head morphogenesis protein
MRRTRRQEKDETVAYFEKVRRVESQYRMQLRRIARHIDEIIQAFPEADLETLPQLQLALQRYADTLDPWAEATAARLVAQIAQRDASAWFRMSREIGVELRDEIMNTPLGMVARQIIADQVGLIRSMPLQAAERVQELTLEAVLGGRRYSDAVEQIQNIGKVNRNRATLIARTETARAQTAITTARARYVGVTHAIWETARDADVRPLHQKLQSKVFALDDPPIIGEKGERGLPGQIYNCRCWYTPLFPSM